MSLPPPTENLRTLLPDLPDDRDHVFDLSTAPNPLPKSVDLRPMTPPVFDQTGLESCTANAIAAAIQYERRKLGLLPDFTPSRLFIWFNERFNELTEELNKGASIRDGIKSVAAQGICPESEWEYDVAKFKLRPPQESYESALKRRLVSYRRLPGFNEMKACLASGYPFVFGMFLFEPIGTPLQSDVKPVVSATGEYPDPKSHAMLAVGYDDSTQRFLIRNSWGEHWGDGGHFTAPYWMFRAPIVFDSWALMGIEETA